MASTSAAAAPGAAVSASTRSTSRRPNTSMSPPDDDAAAADRSRAMAGSSSDCSTADEAGWGGSNGRTGPLLEGLRGPTQGDDVAPPLDSRGGNGLVLAPAAAHAVLLGAPAPWRETPAPTAEAGGGSPDAGADAGTATPPTSSTGSSGRESTIAPKSHDDTLAPPRSADEWRRPPARPGPVVLTPARASPARTAELPRPLRPDHPSGSFMPTPAAPGAASPPRPVPAAPPSLSSLLLVALPTASLSRRSEPDPTCTTLPASLPLDCGSSPPVADATGPEGGAVTPLVRGEGAATGAGAGANGTAGCTRASRPRSAAGRPRLRKGCDSSDAADRRCSGRFCRQDATKS